MRRGETRGRRVARPLQDAVLHMLREWTPVHEFTVPREPHYTWYAEEEDFGWRYGEFPQFEPLATAFDRVIAVGNHGVRTTGSLHEYPEFVGWLAGIDEEIAAAIEAAALAAAEFLREQIAYWSTMSGELPILRDAALCIVSRRSDLASIRWVLEHLARGTHKLDEHLASIDAAVMHEHSLLWQIDPDWMTVVKVGVDANSVAWWVEMRGRYYDTRRYDELDRHHDLDDYRLPLGPPSCPRCQLWHEPHERCPKPSRRREYFRRREQSPGWLASFIEREFPK